MDPGLRERLAQLMRQAATPGTGADGEPGGRRPRSRPSPGAGGGGARKKPIPLLETLLPGREVRTASGACWLHERPLDRWPGGDPALAGRLAGLLARDAPADLERDAGWALWRDLGLESALFLDLETTGLSATPVFLAGLLACDPGGFVFRLYMARHYGEEASLLEAVAAEVERRPVVITYNGKSYDLPFLRERTGRLRLPGIRPGAVLDMLHPARRRWGGRLPDCRLQTLEWHLCRRRRAGDIAGKDIPAAYHRFVRDRDARPMIQVLTHNLIDLYTLAEVTEKIALTPCEPGPAPPII